MTLLIPSCKRYAPLYTEKACLKVFPSDSKTLLPCLPAVLMFPISCWNCAILEVSMFGILTVAVCASAWLTDSVTDSPTDCFSASVLIWRSIFTSLIFSSAARICFSSSAASILNFTGRSISDNAALKSDFRDSLFIWISTLTGSSPVAIWLSAVRKLDTICSSFIFRSRFMASPVPVAAFWTAFLRSEATFSVLTFTSRSSVVFAASAADWMLFFRFPISIPDAAETCCHAVSSTTAFVWLSMFWYGIICCAISALAFFIKSNAWITWSACVVIFSEKCSGKSDCISPQIEEMSMPLPASRTIFPMLFCNNSL